MYVCVSHSERLCSAKKHAGRGCRQWFVFEHELVLPEYIIHFEYIVEVINFVTPL